VSVFVFSSSVAILISPLPFSSISFRTDRLIPLQLTLLALSNYYSAKVFLITAHAGEEFLTELIPLRWG
jgi:hypothetical protein